MPVSNFMFDEQFYRDLYPDVARAIELGQFANAEEHFNLFGRFEQRDPNALFDTSYYLQQYPDVAAAGVDAFTHFLTFGSFEGRLFNAEQSDAVNQNGNSVADEFDSEAYLAANPDVADAIPGSFVNAYQHYVLFGQFEIRTGVQLKDGTQLSGPFASDGSTGTTTPAEPTTPTEPEEPTTPPTTGGGSTPPNAAPTVTGVPSDVTVNEDLASSIDLSAVTASDVDTKGDLTFTISASAGTLAASSAGDVTVAGSGTAEITLTGTAAEISTYLDVTTAIQYTSALNANGDDAATLTLTGSDGNSTVKLGTVNVDITAVNDEPTATDVPGDVTVTEDVASNVDLSAITFADVDAGGADITFTIAATAGTLAASDGDGVTITGSTGNTIVLTGTAAEIDTYLNTASNIKYTSALNANGDDADTLTLSANDGGNTGSGGGTDVNLGTVSVDITAVNDAPTLQNNGSDFNTNEFITIQTSELEATDIDTDPSNLVYTIDRVPNHGTLHVNYTMGPPDPITQLIEGDTFTQADIDADRLQYRDYNTEGNDSFDFQLTDGGVSITGQTFVFTDIG